MKIFFKHSHTILGPLWIVCWVAIRSDPRFMSNESRIEPWIPFAIKCNKNFKVFPLFVALFLSSYIKYRIVVRFAKSEYSETVAALYIMLFIALLFYNFRCGIDYVGDYCQDVNPCLGTVCKNNATCQVSTLALNHYTAECICQPGMYLYSHLLCLWYNDLIHNSCHFLSSHLLNPLLHRYSFLRLLQQSAAADNIWKHCEPFQHFFQQSEHSRFF